MSPTGFFSPRNTDGIEETPVLKCDGAVKKEHHSHDVVIIKPVKKSLIMMAPQNVENSIFRHSGPAILWDKLRRVGFKAFPAFSSHDLRFTVYS